MRSHARTRSSRLQAAAALVGAALVWTAGCAGGIPGLSAGREPAVDALFAEYDRPDAPGCSLGVIRDGAFAYRRGYGLANVELDVPLDADSVFRVGSVSKQFTAMTVLLLEEEGLLALDDDVRHWLPELPDFGETITIRHLIGHTSGLRDYLVLTRLAGYRDEDYYTAADLLGLLTRQRALNFMPGEATVYSNSGYFLLSLIVERAAGESLAEAAQRRIFGPLGMRSTRFQEDTAALVPGRATGYVPDEERGFRIAETTLPIVGDGGVFTSVNDLLAWDANFYDNRLGAGDPALIERWLEPVRLDDGSSTGYSAGIIDGEYRGVRLVSHGGAFVGFRADMLRFPDQRLSIVLLCNLGTANPSALARRVADHYLSDFLDPVEPDADGGRAVTDEAEEFLVPVAELRDYDGRYLCPELGVTYVLELRDGRLHLDIAGRREAWLKGLGDGRLQVAGERDELRMQRDASNRITGFFLDAGRVTDLWFERLQ